MKRFFKWTIISLLVVILVFIAYIFIRCRDIAPPDVSDLIVEYEIIPEEENAFTLIKSRCESSAKGGVGLLILRLLISSSDDSREEESGSVFITLFVISGPAQNIRDASAEGEV